MYSSKEKASMCMAVMQEQQNSVKQLVIHSVLSCTVTVDAGGGACWLSHAHQTLLCGF